MSDWVEKHHQQKRTKKKGGPGSGHWGHAGRPGKRGGSLPGKARGRSQTPARTTVQAESDMIAGVPVFRGKNLPEQHHEDFVRSLAKIPPDVRNNIKSIIFVESSRMLRMEEGEAPKAAHTYATHTTERTGPGIFDLQSEYDGSTIEMWGKAYWNKTLWHEAGHIHYHKRGIVTGVHITREQAEEYAEAYVDYISAGAKGTFKPPFEVEK